MTYHPPGAQVDVTTNEWPRDFDFRACRAEQQELLAPPHNTKQPDEGKTQ